MARLTAKQEDGTYAAADVAAAVQKLARLENLADSLLARQQILTAELAKGRAQERTRTAGFRERMGERMLNDNTISLLRTHGLLP